MKVFPKQLTITNINFLSCANVSFLSRKERHLKEKLIANNMSRLLGDVVAAVVAVDAAVAAVVVVVVDAAAGFSSSFRSEKRTIEKHH